MKTQLRSASALGLALLAACLLWLTPNAQAQINYQGRLTDSNGANLADGPYNVEFSLWDAAQGGSQLWGPYVSDGGVGTGRGPKAYVVNGLFNVVIGSQDTTGRVLAAALSGAGTAHLQIKVGTAAPILPRQAILASPRALTLPNVTPVGGLVGIGKPNPAETLDVNGGIRLTRGNGPVLSIFDSEANQTGARWGLYNDFYQAGSLAIARFDPNQGGWNGGLGLVIRPNANVGIGTTDPRVKLEVAGSAWFTSPGENHLAIIANGGASSLDLASVTSPGNWSQSASPLDAVIRSTNGKLHLQTGGGASAITIGVNNNVGVGSANPMKAKLVVAGVNGAGTSATIPYFLYLNPASTDTSLGHSGEQTRGDLGIHSEAPIAAPEFFAFSDERIKRVTGRSDAARDLATLRGIEITDYTYRDPVTKGGRPQKKVIAQQVEQVFPQAVSRSTDVVPDLYEKATVKDGWVELATHLKVGERVRLLGEQAEGIYEVLEVRPGAFRTAFQPTTGRVFVYGREVNDFRSVDYEAIAMLHVSATQELARRLSALEERNARLEQQLADQAAGTAALLSRLGQLERALGTRGVESAGLEASPKPAAAATRFAAFQKP
jgi:hypothetical protein